MKFRDSGMPQEEMWKQFFDPEGVLNKLEINKEIHTLVDIGTGYGTFFIPEARRVSKAIGIDIEKEMVDICTRKLEGENIKNAEILLGDISKEESVKLLEKYFGEVDYVSLFNILHCEEPLKLISSAYKLLSEHGKLGVIHWKYEKTPRGPAMDIRPKPEAIIEWATQIGFKFKKQVDLEPYHFGLIFVKE